MNLNENIIKLGFDDWFQDKLEQSENDFVITRVSSVNKNNFLVHDGKKEIQAELTGKFMFDTESPFDYPSVGDWVYTRLYNDETLAIIFNILPRKSLLKRKTSGSKIDYQLIAANIDYALIIQSLDSNYNLRRLERYLVMVNESNITPIILLSKSDLLPPDEVEKRKEDIRNILPDVEIISFSNNNENDINLLEELFISGKTYCMLGSSGVGKTTLLNNLMDEEIFKTQEIREKDGRGKHTTTRRQLLILKNGAIIIDNPGMRELGVISVDEGLNETFNEISELSKDCKYKDCTHTTEKGCAVLSALQENRISKERYNNYIKMYKESVYNEMSYYEKRKKDKQFGKFMNNYLKNKKDKG